MLETPPNPLGRRLILTICGIVVLALLWAIFGRIDVAAVAPGQIIVAGFTKVVQPAEMGVVRRIHVENGQRVEEGEVLVELDPTQDEADVNRLARETVEARVDVARLQAVMDALAYEALTPRQFPMPAGAPSRLAQTAYARMRSALAEHRATISGLAQEQAKLEARRERAAAELASLNEVVPMLEERAVARRKLAAKGIAARSNLLELEQEAAEARGRRAATGFTLEETEAALQANGQERARAEAEFRRARLDELAEAQARLAQAEQELAKAKRRLELRTLRAPASGRIQELAVTTEGGVVQPAQELMRIVPDDAALEFEARIENKDIGFVQEGQKVDVKLEAFPFTKFASIDGEVRAISRDAVTQTAQDGGREGGDQQTLYYAARVSLATTMMEVEGRPVPLTAGMAGSADVKTGQRRIIEFLLAPLARAASEAMRER